jgi:hypothetical protein
MIFNFGKVILTTDILIRLQIQIKEFTGKKVVFNVAFL